MPRRIRCHKRTLYVVTALAIMDAMYNIINQVIALQGTMLMLSVLTSGCFIIILSLAIVGACKERITILLISGIGGAIVLTLVTTAAIIVVVNIAQHKRESLREDLEKKYEQYGPDSTTQPCLDKIHADYECCGINGPIKIGDSYPKSCCEKLEGDECKNPHTKGCLEPYFADLSFTYNVSLCSYLIDMTISIIFIITVFRLRNLLIL